MTATHDAPLGIDMSAWLEGMFDPMRDAMQHDSREKLKRDCQAAKTPSRILSKRPDAVQVDRTEQARPRPVARPCLKSGALSLTGLEQSFRINVLNRVLQRSVRFSDQLNDIQ